MINILNNRLIRQMKSDHRTLCKRISTNKANAHNVECGEKNNKLTTKEGMYDWGNMGPTHTGFVNKAINSNGDFQRLYIVDGEIFEQHPVWTFNKESKLLSLDCNIGDEIFNLFKYK